MRNPEQIMKALERRGYEVKRLSHYQYRLECVFDLYTVRFRWHNIANNTRGSWHGMNENQLCELINQQVVIADAILDRMIAAGEITEDGEPIVLEKCVTCGDGRSAWQHFEQNAIDGGQYHPFASRKRDVDSAIWWTQAGLKKSHGKTGENHGN